MWLAGLPVQDRAVLELARRLREAELLATAERLERAWHREAKIVALDVADREAILRVTEDDPALTVHMMAAGVRQVGESWRFAKQPGKSSRIDACIALAMAYSVMVETMVGSVYDQRGLIVI